MKPAVLLGDFVNIIGLDGIVILGVQVVAVVGVILLVRSFLRKNATDRTGSTAEESLRRLGSMRDKGAITEAEYQEQRRRVLSQV